VERRSKYLKFNPGGLVAVWAESNTRKSLFAALQQRHTYATSGPRIALKFSQTSSDDDLCKNSDAAETVMGGTMRHQKDGMTTFYVEALMDKTPLAQIEIIKLSLENAEVKQSIYKATSEKGRATWCLRWQDPNYQSAQPALWYARVLQQATPRWNSPQEGAAVMIQERAWSSPIWSLPIVSKEEPLK